MTTEPEQCDLCEDGAVECEDEDGYASQRYCDCDRGYALMEAAWGPWMRACGVRR